MEKSNSDEPNLNSDFSNSEFSWKEFISEVSRRIPAQQFQAWIEPIRLLEVKGGQIVLGTPTPFSRDWVQDHYGDVFTHVLRDHYGATLQLRIDVCSAEQLEMNLQNTASPSDSDDGEDKDTSLPLLSHLGEEQESLLSEKISNPRSDPQEEMEAEISSTEAYSTDSTGSFIVRTLGETMDPKHTFETFVVGASNQFAHAAARAVAEQPASHYNPLFLYSGAGLGKTHLLHAIGNYTLRVNPKARVCYISAEKFVNDLIESIRHEKMTQFRIKYRDSYDILLMDDIQFIAGKDRTQEEFFHTFNALHSTRRQIVVTSDKSPKEIPGLEERIRTRFEWGLIADIQPPEIETRIAILRAKAEMDDIFLPNDVALFLASNIKTNIRELEGALLRLGALADLSGVEISLELAKRDLSGIIKEPVTAVTADIILDGVARHFNLKVADLKSRDRSKRVSLPRQVAMYLIRKYCDKKSYTDIGVLLGGKDHSTILHGVNNIAAEIEVNPETRRHVEDIQNSL